MPPSRRAEDAALGIRRRTDARAPRRRRGRDSADATRMRAICCESASPMCVQVSPRVGGLVHPVALRDVGAHVRLAGADVDDARIRGRHGDRADRADRLAVEDRLPGAPRVARLPHAAVHAAEVEVLRLARNAGHRQNPPSAERADQSPVQVLKQGGIDGGAHGRGDEQRQANDEVAQGHHTSGSRMTEKKGIITRIASRVESERKLLGRCPRRSPIPTYGAPCRRPGPPPIMSGSEGPEKPARRRTGRDRDPNESL